MIESANNIVFLFPIVSVGENVKPVKSFLEESLKNLILELDLYLEKNEDKKFVEYFHERTYLSMFINGIIRADKTNNVTCAQEYPVKFEDGDYGRCDAWLNYKQNIFIIEAKKQRLQKTAIDADHWDIDAWIKWDDEMIRQPQLVKYHISEQESLLLPKYETCYLMTLVFKGIKQNYKQHFKEAQEKLIKEHCSVRDWFYMVGFVKNQEEENIYGIEVYGTIEKVK